MDSILNRIGNITGGTYTNLPVISSTIVWDLNAAPVAVTTLTNGTNIFSTPLNLVAGLSYSLTIIQPASGAAGTISWPKPPYIFPGGAAPTLSSANSAFDEVKFDCDGTSMKMVVFAKNFS